MKHYIHLFIEKFLQAWTACMAMMVQGDLSVLTLHHAFTAGKTGTLTGIAFVIASFLPWDNKWLGIFFTGLFTAIADIIIHPTHFGPELLEAACTGFAAMLIAILYSFNYKKYFKK
jgi:hypothetical protein